MEQKLEDALNYFKKNKGFDNFFIKLKQKLETYEKENAGTVVLENPDEVEREALSLFMGQNYKKVKKIQIKIAKFQQRLDLTKFQGIKVKQLVTKYFGIDIITKKHKKELKQEEINKVFSELLEELKGTTSYNLLNDIIVENQNDYKFLKQQYNNYKSNYKMIFENSFKALNNLPSRKTLISVFSANVLGNPHELDKFNITGKIFLMLLSRKNKINRPSKALDVAQLYYDNNLLIDDLSNMILCKNIIGVVNNKPHKGWLGFVEDNEPMQITLSQLSKLDSLQTYKNYVLVVENPSVFSTISKQTDSIPLVCTYGQIKISGIMLLDLLVSKNIHLYYSGDIDPEGILIADKLKQRYLNNIDLIGFDSETYIKNKSNVSLNKTRLKKLDSVISEEFKDTIDLIKFDRKAAYEEKNIQNIIDFVLNL